jgi:hypothetical protein
MARILLEATEIEVVEDVAHVLGKIVNARDGVREDGDRIVAPAGWIVVSALGTGTQLYLQVARISCVSEGSGRVVDSDRKHDVPAREAQVPVQFDRTSVERRYGDVGEGDEVTLGGVEHVGDTAAVAVAR